MAKTNRTIRFLAIIGVIVVIDATMGVTRFFNGLVQLSILKIFGLKMDSSGMYTSMYASIAVLISSNLVAMKKLKYSVLLFMAYVGIFTFVMAYRVIYPYYSLYMTLIVFMTMTVPILLWVMIKDVDNEQQKNVKSNKKIHGSRR